MKIAIVTALQDNSGAAQLLKIVKDTLSELGEELSVIDLNTVHVPFYGFRHAQTDGSREAVTAAIYSVAACAGVVFAAPSVLNGPPSLLKAFLEHFQRPEFHHVLLDKNCMVITASQSDETRAFFEYMSYVIGRFGGLDAVRVCAPIARLRGESQNDDSLKYIVEKQTEDFYRILRQNRGFFIPGSGGGTPVKPEAAEDLFVPEPSSDEAMLKLLSLKDELEQREISNRQQTDINDITRIFAGKISKQPDTPVQRHGVAPIHSVSAVPKRKSCKQLTQSLPHYFKPQLAAGLSAAVALDISGEERFHGVMTIDGTACSFEECQAADERAKNADMTIIADSKVWTDILTGKYTAQKAFMVGQLKVRGNFLLLSKFDLIFEKTER